jgi:hypothetical protein
MDFSLEFSFFVLYRKCSKKYIYIWHSAHLYFHPTRKMFSVDLPSEQELRQLAFDVKDFHVFGIDGVVRERFTHGTKRTSWSHKHRAIEPDVGEKVGIFASFMLASHQITAIGYVAAKRGTSTNPIYDVWITQVDPKEVYCFGVQERSQPLKLGLWKDMDPRKVVRVRYNAKGTYPGFDMMADNDQKEQFEMLSDQLKSEEKARRKRKSELTKQNKKIKVTK